MSKNPVNPVNPVNDYMNDELIDDIDFPVLFGRFLVLNALVGEADIAQAGALQKELNATAFFVLVEQEVLSVEALQRALAYQREHMVRLGDAIQGLGLLTPERCAEAMRLIEGRRVRLGEILVRQGKITRAALEDALARHRRHIGSLAARGESNSDRSDPIE